MTRKHTPAQTYSVGQLIDTAFAEVATLAQEMQDWYDNMHENLQDGDKGQRVEEAASALESVDQPEVPDLLDAVTAQHTPSTKKRQSRADRLSEARDLLQLAAECARERAEVLAGFADECENAVSELDSVEFPTMYG